MPPAHARQAYGFRQLVDIAESVLSPSTNDMTTAVQALDQLHDLLRRLVTRPFPIPAHHAAGGRLRLVLPANAHEPSRKP